MENFRPTRCTGLIGAPGCGKTTKEEELIKLWKRDHPGGLVYGFIPDPTSVLHAHVNIQIEKYDPDWAIKLGGVTNSLFVLDDYVGLMMSEKGRQMYTPTPGMTDVFTSRRYSGNEILFSCHGPRAVIPQLAQYTTHYIIYKTSADEGTFDKRMQGWAKLQKAAKMVNGYCEMIGGMGLHITDPKYSGQGFPHVIMDTTSWTAIPVNMKRNLFKDFIVK